MFTSTHETNRQRKLCDRCRKFAWKMWGIRREAFVHFDHSNGYHAVRRELDVSVCLCVCVCDASVEAYLVRVCVRTKLNHLLKCHWEEKVFFFLFSLVAAAVVVGRWAVADVVFLVGGGVCVWFDCSVTSFTWSKEWHVAFLSLSQPVIVPVLSMGVRWTRVCSLNDWMRV